MFTKSALATALLLVSTSISGVYSHAAIAPALGVKGTPVRNDAQRPSANKPCGNINIAQNIDTSTAVPANADGSFTTTITNFNAGKDGSTSVTAQVDATGAGKSFVAAQVTKNGVVAPKSTGSQQIVTQLPAGTTCKGGKAGNLCLVSFTTAGGFGNCVVVSQAKAAAGGAAGAGAAGAAATPASGAAATGAANNAGAGAAAGNAAATATAAAASVDPTAAAIAALSAAGSLPPVVNQAASIAIAGAAADAAKEAAATAPAAGAAATAAANNAGNTAAGNAAAGKKGVGSAAAKAGAAAKAAKAAKGAKAKNRGGQ